VSTKRLGVGLERSGCRFESKIKSLSLAKFLEDLVSGEKSKVSVSDPMVSFTSLPLTCARVSPPSAFITNHLQSFTSARPANMQMFDSELLDVCCVCL
jgi:hypothetical protein